MVLHNVIRSITSTRGLSLLFKRPLPSQVLIDSQRAMSNLQGKNKDKEAENNEPIPYSTSAAANWLAAHSRCPPNDRPKFEPTVVLLCTLTILVYFCILREPNDIDIILEQSLPNTMAQQQKLIDKS